MTIDERLLLPATPALLDEWCGPVVVKGDPRLAIWCPESQTILTPDGEFVDVGKYGQAVLIGVGTSMPRLVCLDLARAECRDRVARVVFGSPTPALMQEMRKGRAFFPRSGGVGFFARVEAAEDYGGTHVPALADLDPHDPTRLPGGSRLVDALALAAVAREVLGG